MNVPGTGMTLERSAEGLVLLGVVLQMAEAFEMSRYTVIRIRELFAEHDLDDPLCMDERV
jgi:hypothetical protein